MALQWQRTSIYYEGYILKSPSYTYCIGSVLGCGGFGITYLASATVKVGNVSLKGRFAIKEHYMKRHVPMAADDGLLRHWKRFPQNISKADLRLFSGWRGLLIDLLCGCALSHIN